MSGPTPRSRIRPVLAGIFALSLALGAAACGGGEDPEEDLDSLPSDSPAQAVQAPARGSVPPGTIIPDSSVINPEGPVDRGTPAKDPVVPAGGHAVGSYQACMEKANAAAPEERQIMVDACKVLPGAPK